MFVTGMAKREIAYFFFVCAAAAGAVIALAFFTGAAWVYAFTAIPALFYGFVIFFFRDPNRKIPQGEHNIVSPADGYITDVITVNEDEFLGCPATRIGIFLSIFTPHINRSPIAGTVKYVNYSPGCFHNALNSELCSKENEANAIGIESSGVSMLVKQISGVIARRIVCRVKAGDEVTRGQKIGMIKFGSRTELFIPQSVNFRISVKIGERVRAGSTIIGLLDEKEV